MNATVQRKFVRVLERHANGIVRFEFAVGWPDMACELALPAAQFEAFCTQHGVERLAEGERAADPLTTLALAEQDDDAKGSPA